ncbi:TetR/AcrR family transcriptional regulator [Mycolicibacterium sp. 050232]|uniref:TetR/AcrR family transcriptional regulator n=1 Tax=Mycolicibacterium sp. 050232 TaxID=3113982 RepID=UPI002E29E591|nr:TetR/AcrR family transcriptional regulator [Mycolicibacterium sp. 050232]MED5815850.1 TetR/AcrR family transcriptional regulator [Mycolicibacterium sp. 050232]
MSRTMATMGIRESLIEESLQVLEESGPEALSARMLAKRIGASTMAVYTHFDGMPGLYEALVRESYVRFGEHLRRRPDTDDPVADLLASGLAYREYALTYPQRYRLMFGITSPSITLPIGRDVTVDGHPAALSEINSVYAQIPAFVRRCMDIGAIDEGDPVAVAAQIWTMMHGYVLAEIIGVFGTDGGGVSRVLAPHITNLLVGLGGDRERIQQSFQRLKPPPEPPRPNTPVTATVRRGRRTRSP